MRTDISPIIDPRRRVGESRLFKFRGVGIIVGCLIHPSWLSRSVLLTPVLRVGPRSTLSGHPGSRVLRTAGPMTCLGNSPVIPPTIRKLSSWLPTPAPKTTNGECLRGREWYCLVYPRPSVGNVEIPEHTFVGVVRDVGTSPLPTLIRFRK